MTNDYQSTKYLFWSFLLSLPILFGNCQQQSQEEYLFRVSLLVNEQHTWYQAMDYFSQILEERSNGRMRAELYPSEQLGKELESIRMIQAGVIDMTVSASTLSNWIEIATFCEMPFLLRDTIEKRKMINGFIGQQVEKEMIEKVGLRPVAVFERGPRHLTSNRPIRHPDDLKGMILRVPNVPSFVTAWSAMGAKPTPMAFSEVFTSLQQGTVEGQENPFALILSAGFTEVQKYVNLTGHVMSWSYPVVGEKQFQRLPDDLKTIFLACAKDMERYQHKMYLENEAAIQAQLKEKGMEFIEVDNAAFGDKCEQAIYDSLSPEMQKLYKQFVAQREE